MGKKVKKVAIDKILTFRSHPPRHCTDHLTIPECVSVSGVAIFKSKSIIRIGRADISIRLHYAR